MDKNNESTALQPFQPKVADLSAAQPSAIPMTGDYWTPTEVGEKKRVYYVGTSTMNTINKQTGEDIELPIVLFAEPDNKGSYNAICNGSVRLVQVFENYAKTLQKGDAFEIEYLGKKKTTSGNFCDNWSVRSLQ